MESRSQQLNHRFYESELPKEGDVVIVEILKVEEIGITIALLEYNKIEGMMNPNEYSTRVNRRVNILKTIKVGREEVHRVLRVDHEQGFIDLSKKDVNADENQYAKKRYSRAKKVHSILQHVILDEKVGP